MKNSVIKLYKKLSQLHFFALVFVFCIISASVLYIHNNARAYKFSTISELYALHDQYEIQAEKETHGGIYTDHKDLLDSVIDGYEKHDIQKMNSSYLEYLLFNQEFMPYTDYDTRLKIEEATYLTEGNIERELSSIYPLSGVNFMVQYVKVVLPYIYLVTSCLVFSVLFTSKEAEDHKQKHIVIESTSALIISIFLLHAVPFIIGTILLFN